GGGGLEHNVTSYEVLPRPHDLKFHSGTIHTFSVSAALQESEDLVKKLYPVVPGKTVQTGSPDCPSIRTVPDFDPVRTQSAQSTALFGAGWIDLISDRAILRNARNRGLRAAVGELQFKFADIPVGRVRSVA